MPIQQVALERMYRAAANKPRPISIRFTADYGQLPSDLWVVKFIGCHGYPLYASASAVLAYQDHTQPPGYVTWQLRNCVAPRHILATVQQRYSPIQRAGPPGDDYSITVSNRVTKQSRELTHAVLCESRAAVWVRNLMIVEAMAFVGRDSSVLSASRIRREGFFVFIGQHRFDVDELRNHFVEDQVLPALRALNPPPTAEEFEWVSQFFEDYPARIRARILLGMREMMDGSP